MKRTRLLVLVFSTLWAVLAWGGSIQAAVQDTVPPTINHTPVSSAYSNAKLIVRTRVSDTSLVERVTLFFRTKGTSNYYSMNMSKVGSEYRAVISSSFMQPGTIEYYIQATDTAGNVAYYPANQTGNAPQAVVVHKDNTMPQPELIEPTGSVSSNGYSVFVVFRDLAGNVDSKSIRVYYNDQDVTAKANISDAGVSYQVPASDVTLHSNITIEAADLAGNRAKRSFSFWKAPDWSRELRVDVQPEKDIDSKLDMSMDWGPLYLSANLRANDPFFTKLAGQPENNFELRYDARLLRLAVGDITSSVAPLALSSYQHRGTDLTLRLGPLSLQGVYGFPQLYVEGEDYQRKVIAIRPAFDTRGLDMALSLVKVRDDASGSFVVSEKNPEVNYVLDAQIGLAAMGGKAGVGLETALSFYHDNARGDLWPVLDSLEEMNGGDEMSATINKAAAMLKKTPHSVRDFFELPDILQYGLPKVDLGLQANARMPLPWSEAEATLYHFGKTYQTIAGGGTSNADGGKVSYSTIRLLNALQLAADCERKFDNAQSLYDFIRQTDEGARTASNSCSAKVSVGPAGRLNLDLGATYVDEALAGNPIDKTTKGYTVDLRNMRFKLFGAGFRFGANAGLSQLDVVADPEADKQTQTYKINSGLDLGSWSYDFAYGEKQEIDADGKTLVTNPNMDGSITWTLRKPHLLLFTPQDIRFRVSGSQDQTLNATADKIAEKSGYKLEADTRLTAGLRLNGAWQKQMVNGKEPETKWNASLRWRF